MKTLFEQLPGIPMPVAQVTQALAHMWDGEGEDNILSKTHATQVNLVLHVGTDANIESALQSFQTAVAFAQNYPCRIIVLCPLGKDSSSSMSAKLYSQCFIGSDFRETCCCEALILAHNEQDYTFLDSQISTWLEPDLPIYYWFYGVSPELICKHIRFLKHCTRIIYDSSAETLDCQQYNWPKPQNLQDLAKARILPWRQSIGQILANTPPQPLVEGLESIEIIHSPNLKAESKNLLDWVQKSLDACFKASSLTQSINVKCSLSEIDEADWIKLEWHYSQKDKYFYWEHKKNTPSGYIRIKMPHQTTSESVYIRDLAPHQLLSEAFYFNT
jgi:glucose-6-phosphate dehydrogenase assembly protein OpcA